jgi:superfamily II DNA/RNA helicase
MSVTFADLGVPADLVSALSRTGIEIPFPIQAATLPDALHGRDICGRAPTGSGKTLAFGLAALAACAPSGASGGNRRGPGRPYVLILVPTRELAGQVERALGDLSARSPVRITSVYGGVSYGKQRAALRRGIDVLVACPGRLQDLVQQGDVNLDQVGMVVIDEADRMADMGFLPVVKQLLDQTSPERQTLLFSATLDGDVDVLVRRYQKNPSRHEIPVEAEVRGDVRHLFWRTDAQTRVTLTAEVVAAHAPAIVFCRTKRGADRLTKRLAGAGIEAVTIHGDRSQPQRERALAAFSAGRAQALVATDVAARGIHVDGVASVVHFDLPPDSKDYVHRSGRTGRAGADGLVVALVGPDQTREAGRLQRELGFEPGVLAPNVAGLPASPARPVGPDRRVVRERAHRLSEPHRESSHGHKPARAGERRQPKGRPRRAGGSPANRTQARSGR